MLQGEVTTTPYAEVVDKVKPIDPRLWKLAHVLAR
jgi:hypothetical protein